jgi:hypothetical protein
MLHRIGTAVVLLGMLSVSYAQNILGQMVKEVGVDWIIGQWETTTKGGDTVTVTFKADLNDHIGTIHYKDPRLESKGIVVVDPESGIAKYYLGDNQGGVGAGVWSAEDQKAILKIKLTAADGKSTRMGMIFRKVDADTIEVKHYELSDTEELGHQIRATLTLKRKK